MHGLDTDFAEVVTLNGDEYRQVALESPSPSPKKRRRRGGVNMQWSSMPSMVESYGNMR
jgi:hypothetical protein